MESSRVELFLLIIAEGQNRKMFSFELTSILGCDITTLIPVKCNEAIWQNNSITYGDTYEEVKK